MYCTHCGMKFDGRFCPVCGHEACEITEEYMAAEKRIVREDKHERINPRNEYQKIEPNRINGVTVEKPPRKGKGSIGLFLIILAMAAITGLVFWAAITNDASSEAVSEPIPTATPISAKPLPFPSNGRYEIYDKATWSQMIQEGENQTVAAPFKVTVPALNKYYYIQLRDHLTGKRAVSLYIHGGKSFETNVPFGTYKLYYCCGDTWYGLSNLFLEEGGYYESDSLLTFYDDGEYLCGQEVALEVSHGGNMDRDIMTFDSFPK